MNQDVIKGKWHEVKGKIKSKWGRLTDDDMTRMEGDLEHAAGILQKRYGIAKDEAERQWDDFRRQIEGNTSGVGNPANPATPRDRGNSADAGNAAQQ